jgi:hypothetical protein
MAIEKLRTEQEKLEKDERAKTGIPEEPEDTLTVKDIINNKEQSALLGDLVEHGGDPEDKKLMERLVSGKLGEADFSRLAELRKDFSEKMRDAETIKEEMTPELAQELAKNNPYLKDLIENVSPEGMIRVVSESIKRMSVTDPENFEKVSKQIENVKSFREGDFKKLDESTVEMCKKLGINVDAFMEKGAVKGFDERQKALVDLVKSEWGKQGGLGVLKKVGNFFTGDFFSKMKATTLEGKRQEIMDAYAKLDGYKKKLGSVLAGSLSDNKDLIDALNREISGTPKKKEVFGMNDAKKQMLDEDNFKRGWQKVKNNIKNWDTLDEKARDVHRDNYMKQFETDGKAELAKAKGFWALIFGGVFDMMFAGFDKKSLN